MPALRSPPPGTSMCSPALQLPGPRKLGISMETSLRRQDGLLTQSLVPLPCPEDGVWS